MVGGLVGWSVGRRLTWARVDDKVLLGDIELGELYDDKGCRAGIIGCRYLIEL